MADHSHLNDESKVAVVGRFTIGRPLRISRELSGKVSLEEEENFFVKKLSYSCKICSRKKNKNPQRTYSNISTSICH